MITGPCNQKVYVCPYCDRIHKGVTDGGLIRQCDFCGFYALCNAKERKNKGEIEIGLEMCPDCLIDTLDKLVGGGYG